MFIIALSFVPNSCFLFKSKSDDEQNMSKPGDEQKLSFVNVSLTLVGSYLTTNFFKETEIAVLNGALGKLAYDNRIPDGTPCVYKEQGKDLASIIKKA